MRVDYAYYHVLRQLALQGGISAIARALCLSKPAVSKSVAHLKKQKPSPPNNAKPISFYA